VDVFLHNFSDRERRLLLLHRGSLCGLNVSAKSWSLAETSQESFERELTTRIISLHENFDPIEFPQEGTVAVAGHEYRVWQGPEELPVVVGDRDGTDVPFTMWDVGGFTPGQRHLLRVRLSMAEETFEKQVGNRGFFDAYGEAILLRKIEQEDLPHCAESDTESYWRGFDRFQAADHVVPDTFEYLVVSPIGTELRWETTALSQNLSCQFVPPGELRSCTRWFVADNSDSEHWCLEGRRCNGFVVEMTAAEVSTQQCLEHAAV
jgi:hypothetical protein